MRMRSDARARPARVRPPYAARGRSEFSPDHVDGVIDAAVAACTRHDAGGLAGAVGLLAMGPPGPDGPPLVDRALGRRLLARLGEAWAAGWQPADLARVVGRDLGRSHGHLAADAIVREAALYPPSAVPQRWRDQVDELAGGVRRAPARTDDPRWAVPGPGHERAGAVRVAVETLSLLGRLPPVPKLGAVPGEGVAGDGGDAEVDPRMLQRVRALLAKAESTTFPEEAEALTAKAQELMARYAIDAALVASARGDAPDVGGRRVGVDDPYAAAKAMLLEAIASANRCRSVWTRSFGYATVFGAEADLDAVELLYTSLLVQAARAMFARASPGGRASPGRTRSYRQSFLVAFSVRIGDRLRAAVDAATEATTSVRREALLPVLANNRRAAEEACDAAFPEIKPTTVTAKDWAGWQAGRKAADAAQLGLHSPVTSGGSPAGGSGGTGGSGGPG